MKSYGTARTLTHTYGYRACAHRALGFFKYSGIIYRWKAYEEVMRTFVEKNEIFHFGPKMDRNRTKKGNLVGLVG